MAAAAPAAASPAVVGRHFQGARTPWFARAVALINHDEYAQVPPNILREMESDSRSHLNLWRAIQTPGSVQIIIPESDAPITTQLIVNSMASQFPIRGNAVRLNNSFQYQLYAPKELVEEAVGTMMADWIEIDNDFVLNVNTWRAFKSNLTKTPEGDWVYVTPQGFDLSANPRLVTNMGPDRYTAPGPASTMLQTGWTFYIETSKWQELSVAPMTVPRQTPASLQVQAKRRILRMGHDANLHPRDVVALQPLPRKAWTNIPLQKRMTTSHNVVGHHILH